MSDGAVRDARIAEVIAALPAIALPILSTAVTTDAPQLRVIVYDLDAAREAAAGGATEIVLDPFIRHPAPPLARVAALRDELTAA